MPSAYRFVQYFYFTSDGSKHKDRDRHGMIMSQSNSKGIPHFEVVTASGPMGAKDAKGLATLNVDAAREFIPPSILAHLGGQVTDNEATTALEQKITSTKVMKFLQTTKYRSTAMPETMKGDIVFDFTRRIVDGRIFIILKILQCHIA